QELLTRRIDFPDRDGERGVAVIPFKLDAEIHRQDVALFHHALPRRNSVHHFLIDGSAKRLRVAVIALERRTRMMLARIFLGKSVQLKRGDAGPDHLAQFRERAPDDDARTMHGVELRSRAADNHARPSDFPRTPNTESVTAVLPAAALISSSIPCER